MSGDDDLLADLLSWRGPPPTLSPLGSGLSEPVVPTNVLLSGGAKARTRSPTCVANPTVDNGAAPELVLPPALKDRLLPHQVEGVTWLYRRHRVARACLLADEMGLGKTVQVCAFLGLLYASKSITTTIIVAPPTLLPMWESALSGWAQLDANVVEAVHQQTKAKREGRWKKLRFGLPCVMLTTYGVLRQDAASVSSSLVDYVVLDEAHLIKDASTNVFRSALMLSARHKIAMTGTPLMNSFEDMWSIFRFLDGSIIDMKRSDFGAVSALLLRGNERDATGNQRMEAEAELAKLQTAIRPYMLRREKRHVGVVGSRKHDNVVWVPLSPVQRALYDSFVASKEVMCSRAEGSRINPLLLLTTLCQLCNHPWLSLSDQAFVEAVKQPQQAPCEDLGNMMSGPKLQVALAIIQRAIGKHRKTLVFSRSKRLLTMLAAVLVEHGVLFARVDGDTANLEERYRAVQDFTSREDLLVCLLTTQVGGVGLTFETTSCVILLDPSWNPSADAQAVDRVHRIGQRQDVFVFRLVSCGTVEEKVYRNQVFKTMAAKQSLQAEGDYSEFFRYFTRLQLHSMFDVGDLDASETAQQLELLHPNCVSPEAMELVRGIGGVSAVSDNGSVLMERVVPHVEELLSSQEELSPSRRRAPQPLQDRREAAKRPRHEVYGDLSQQEAADLLDEIDISYSNSGALRATPLDGDTP